MCKQTDDTLNALAVDNEGMLTLTWVDSSGLWQGPFQIFQPLKSLSE
jgi:hypothetical protein